MGWRNPESKNSRATKGCFTNENSWQHNLWENKCLQGTILIKYVTSHPNHDTYLLTLISDSAVIVPSYQGLSLSYKSLLWLRLLSPVHSLWEFFKNLLSFKLPTVNKPFKRNSWCRKTGSGNRYLICSTIFNIWIIID